MSGCGPAATQHHHQQPDQQQYPPSSSQPWSPSPRPRGPSQHDHEPEPAFVLCFGVWRPDVAATVCRRCCMRVRTGYVRPLLLGACRVTKRALCKGCTSCARSGGSAVRLSQGGLRCQGATRLAADTALCRDTATEGTRLGSLPQRRTTGSWAGSAGWAGCEARWGVLETVRLTAQARGKRRNEAS